MSSSVEKLGGNQITVPAEVWYRVVHVSCGSEFGTGLVLDHEDRQYLVTARHVVESGIKPAIRQRGTVVSVGLTALTIPDGAADVAVFRLDQSIVPPNLPLVAGTKDMVFGQDAYFLGFPYGLTFDLGGEDFPLVKRCTVSATNRSFQGRNVLLLDGWNNPGFSGGPVVFRPLTAEGLREPMKVAGIITKYASYSESVIVNGQIVQGAEVPLNSGIIIAEDISRATDAIEADA
jgi:Trypsin-like peptidase domain